MLKKRIGAGLLVKDNWVVQSIGFNKYLPVGRPEIAVEYLNKWGIDEIILFDISATRKNKVVDPRMVSIAAGFCRVPLAVGGGISSLSEMETLIQNGADKICLNHILLHNKQLLTEGARVYGDQCMIAVVDFVKGQDGNYEVYDHKNRKSTGRNVIDFVKELEQSAAGEILLQSVQRDGMYNGFETELYKKVCDVVNLPVIAMGGAGKASDFSDLLKNTGVSAACAGNIFHFTEHSVNMIKAQIKKEIPEVRLETHASYEHNDFDKKGRLKKAGDQYLEDLLFIRIEKEVI